MSTNPFTSLRRNDGDSHDDNGDDSDDDNEEEENDDGGHDDGEHIPWTRHYARHLPQ